MKKWGVLILFSFFSLPVFAFEWSIWEPFSVPRQSGRHWICGMDSVSGTDKMKGVSIKLIESTPFIQLDLHQGGWSFPQGAFVPVSLDFDDNEPLDLDAYGDGQIVSIAIPAGLTSTFLSLVNEKKRIRIFFRNSHETVWTISMDGASEALMGMLACYKKWSVLPKKSH